MSTAKVAREPSRVSKTDRKFAGVALRTDPDLEGRLDRLAATLGLARAAAARVALLTGLDRLEGRKGKAVRHVGS